MRNENKFETMYLGSYITWTGIKDPEDAKKSLNEMFEKCDLGVVEDWINFTGKEMNDYYGLTGDNAYADDLHCFAGSLDKLDTNKVAIIKLKIGARWFDDIVANDLNREYGEYHYHDEYCDKSGRFHI